MDNEKYGIELELVTGKFKEKMQEIKSSFASLTDKKVNLNANTTQIEYLKKQIGELTADLQVNAKTHFWNSQETLKAEAQLEKLTNQYNKLIQKQNEVSAASTKSSINITKGLDKMTSKIKRFGLALLSIRSIYALVSRASSAYLAQDTDLANRLQSAWAGLGAMLAPIIERIVNLIAKAVKYINIFIKALTGVDLLARATAKSMGGTAKAAKSLNKALAGFDELQNLDTDAGGGGTDLGAGLGGLEDVEINTEWADKIRAFGEWFAGNWEYVTAGLLGTYAAIKLIAGGVSIIKGLGIGLLVAGIVLSIASLIDYLNNPTWENFGQIIQGIGIALLGLAVIIGSVPLAVTGAIVLIVGTIVKYWDKIKATLQKGIDWLISKVDWVKEHFGLIGETIYTSITDTLQAILDFVSADMETMKAVFDKFISFFKNVFAGNWKAAWQDIKDIFVMLWDNIKAKLSIFATWLYDTVVKPVVNIFTGLWDAIKKGATAAWDWTVKTVTNVFNSIVDILTKVKNWINTKFIQPVANFFANLWNSILTKFKNSWNKIANAVNKVGTKLGITLPVINSYAVGTNYVPEDQLAMVHQGEAIIPKKFNSQEYFGGANDETNALLKELISKVEGIEINPYTTIKDVGKASLSYINNKSRQLGESVVV